MAIVGVLAASCVLGLWRGLIREIMSLLTWIAALLVARLYSENFALILEFVGDTTVRYVLSFALLFTSTMMLGTLVSHIFSAALSWGGMRVMDRMLGGVFGIFRGVVVVVAALFLSWTFFSDTREWKESQLIPYGRDIIEYSSVMLS